MKAESAAELAVVKKDGEEQPGRHCPATARRPPLATGRWGRDLYRPMQTYADL